MKPTLLRPLALILAAAAASTLVTGCGREESSPLPKSAADDRAAAPATAPNPATAPAERRRTISMVDDPTEFDIKGDVKPDPYLPKLIQTLGVFDHPDSCIVSADSKFLFVTNTAYSGEGFNPGKGFISKLEIQPDGRLKMAERRFADGLSAPHGITLLPKATKKFPVGTILVCTGTTAQNDSEGNLISDIKKYNPGVTFIDPDTAKVVGFIPMWPGSAISQALADPNAAKPRPSIVLAPNGLAFDPDGNLYVCDTGHTGRHLQPPVIGRPGIMRIKHQDIDAFSENRMPGAIQFLRVRHGPKAVYYSSLDDGLYWTTCDGDGPAGGAIYRMIRKDFPQENMAPNLAGGLNGPLGGLAITPIRGLVNDKRRWGGTLIFARANAEGDLMYMNAKAITPLVFFGDQQPTFAMPGDLRIHVLANNWLILYVPERDENSEKKEIQKLRVILLPTMM